MIASPQHFQQNRTSEHESSTPKQESMRSDVSKQALSYQQSNNQSHQLPITMYNKVIKLSYNTSIEGGEKIGILSFLTNSSNLPTIILH